MASRIREGQRKLIDVFVHLIHNTENSDNTAIWCYPTDGLTEDLRKSVPKFAFPFSGNFVSSNIDCFTFVLTDIDGKFKFGFCRLAAGSESCLCIISSYPWFEIFYKLLNNLASAMNASDGSLELLLDELLRTDPSNAGGTASISITVGKHQITFDFPNPDRLPSIPENKNLTEYYNAIDGQSMITIFASMLFERRIIIKSRKLSRLTACVYAATSLIYPLNWQHIFIPVLPSHLIDFISAPMPYLIGVHSSVLESAKNVESDDAVIVDADNRTVQHCFNDLTSLPSSVVSSLRKDLNLHQKNDSHCSLTGDKLSQAFLKAMVSLIGTYRTALLEHDGKLSFDMDAFVRSHPSSMQSFLQRILESQSFEQFIAERALLSRHQLDPFEDAIQNQEKTKNRRGSVKNKVNHQLVHITKKMTSTGKKTLSSMKRKLDFKKNGDDRIEVQRSMPSQVQNAQPTPMQHINNSHSIQNTDDAAQKNYSDTQPILRPKQNSETPNHNRRHSYCMSIADEDYLDLNEGDSLSNFSSSDRTTSNPDVNHDVITLSSFSSDSCQDNEKSDSLQILINRHQEDAEKEEDEKEEVRLKVDDNQGVVELCPDCVEDECTINVSDNKSEEMDAVFLSPSAEDDKLKTSLPNKDPPQLTKQSIRERYRVSKILQQTAPVKRAAVISVQDLPNVKEIIHKFEASSKEQIGLAEISRPGNSSNMSSSFVARQAAMYSSLDRKSRSSSLMRKHAIRSTGPRLKKHTNTDVSSVQTAESRSSSVIKDFESYNDQVDSAKSEENDNLRKSRISHDNSFGCLLRVCSRSASMRQLNVEQGQYSNMGQPSPPSYQLVTMRQKSLQSRRAIYRPTDVEHDMNMSATEISPNYSSDRSAVYDLCKLNPEHVGYTKTEDSLQDSECVTDRLNVNTVSGETESDYEKKASVELENHCFQHSWSFDTVTVDENLSIRLLFSNEQSQTNSLVPETSMLSGITVSSEEPCTNDGNSLELDLLSKMIICDRNAVDRTDLFQQCGVWGPIPFKKT